jgi:hypothetical protein
MAKIGVDDDVSRIAASEIPVRAIPAQIRGRWSILSVILPKKGWL